MTDQKTMLWDSNAPITLTGYGMQTALFVPKFRELGYDITLNCPMSLTTAPISWDGMTMLGSAGDPMGNDVLPQRVAQFDLTISLRDAFGIFQCAPQLAGKPIVHWMPVDTAPMGERDIATLRTSGGVPVAMSRFGYDQIRREGFDPLYVPHGVDTSVFCPGDRMQFRDAVGISPDTFVIGMECVNKPDSRKGIDQQLQAFAIFHQRHPDSILFMHTPQKGGWDIPKIALNLGIHNAIMWPDQGALTGQMITWPTMAAWYRSLDLLSACSEAEGFGLPPLEAQACGTPVVSTRFSAMTELNALGWTVGGQKHWVGGHESWWCTPDVEEIAARYEVAWRDRGDEVHRARCRDFAQGYDVDTVMAEHWKPALQEIEARYGIG